MSFKNMDKLIYPAGYFRLRYSLNCVETHRGVFTVLNLTSGKEVFFFPLWAHKKLLPSNSLCETTLWCSILCFYVTLFSILSLFFSLFPWFSPLPFPIFILSFSSVCSRSISCSFSHVVHHLFPLSYPLLFSSLLCHVHLLVTADVITPTAVFYFPSFLSVFPLPSILPWRLKFTWPVFGL